MECFLYGRHILAYVNIFNSQATSYLQFTDKKLKYREFKQLAHTSK